jgi:catechol-2,3-dioxygenase
MDAVTGIAELPLQARDPARLAPFYAAAFGLEEISREPDRIWLAAGARARLGLWSREAAVQFERPVEHDGGSVADLRG